MASRVAISAIDAVIGGTEIKLGAGFVNLIDSTTGYDGPGSYHIYLKLSTARYFVAQGLPIGDSIDLIRIARAQLTPEGEISIHDVRPINVNMIAVNETIMQNPDPGGRYLGPGSVGPIQIDSLIGLEDLLKDVEITDADVATGYVVAWNGSKWVAASPGGGVVGGGFLPMVIGDPTNPPVFLYDSEGDLLYFAVNGF